MGEEEDGWRQRRGEWDAGASILQCGAQRHVVCGGAIGSERGRPLKARAKRGRQGKSRRKERQTREARRFEKERTRRGRQGGALRERERERDEAAKVPPFEKRRELDKVLSLEKARARQSTIL